jgi:hypothetical protein
MFVLSMLREVINVWFDVRLTLFVLIVERIHSPSLYSQNGRQNFKSTSTCHKHFKRTSSARQAHVKRTSSTLQKHFTSTSKALRKHFKSTDKVLYGRVFHLSWHRTSTHWIFIVDFIQFYYQLKNNP